MRLINTLAIVLVLISAIWNETSGLPVDSNSPLYLTKYIERNATEEGRTASEVMPFIDGVKSYSGLITVDKEGKNHMFFWYFPAENQPDKAPLIIWLNGYSTPSTFGAFLQTGPYKFEEGKLKKKDVSWQKYYHMLHIDNPLGVGYSFTQSGNYSKSLVAISKNLLEVISQFFILFPELSDREMYISGTSTAGKYASALAYRMFVKNKNETKYNLKGMFLGNPYLDPSQISYGDYLYEHGFIDFKEKLNMDQIETNIRKWLKEGDYKTFYEKTKEYMMNRDSYILNVTGLKSRFDYSNADIDRSNYVELMEKPEFKKELHVGNVEFNNGSVAMDNFAYPYAFSVKPWLEDMLSSIKMLFYNGQRDISWAYPMMSTVLTSLKWNGTDGYIASPRIKMYKNADLIGYRKNYDTLTDVLILNAGHTAIVNQPEIIFDLLNNFTQYKIL